MTKIVIAAALVALVACKSKKADNPDQVAKLPVPTKLPPPPTGSAAPGEDHAAQIDNEYATLVAMYNAPAGATSCDSLYNAIEAEQDAAKKLKRDSVFSFVAAKPEFLKLCNELPAKTQACLVPAYQSHHGKDCDGVTMENPLTAKLYTLRQDLLQPPKEAGELPHQ